jgi:hypothetical protein
MRNRMAVRVMEMGAGSRLALAAVLAALLWTTVWWAL